MARQREVYGSEGSAILVEPFEPGRQIRLCLESPHGPYTQGEQFISLRVLRARLPTNASWKRLSECYPVNVPPIARPDHELLVQETLLRAVGKVEG